MLRNPWGHGGEIGRPGEPRDGVDDGVFKLSVDELKATFEGLSVETSEPRLKGT
jgi:hypothetical protein